ncbi:hypothetical protein [Leuconostoc pseudomesenteroides]|uniref:hypothetical protein n=1 Tax=Leuconostoc pseudomesenteroides TaxID=33968 RepID=UPI0032E02BB2
MTEDETKGFVDTTPQAGNGDQYRDPEHIPAQNEFTAEIKSGVVDSKSRTLLVGYDTNNGESMSERHWLFLLNGYLLNGMLYGS